MGKLRPGEAIAPHDMPQHSNHPWWKRKLRSAVARSVGITSQVSRIVEVARLGDRALNLGTDAACPHPREPTTPPFSRLGDGVAIPALPAEIVEIIELM